MAEPSRFVGRNPRDVVLDPLFWVGNPRLILALVASVLAGVALMAGAGNERGMLPLVPAIAIYLLVFWGVWMGARAVARLEVEYAIAQTVDSRAGSWLRKISASEVARPDLDQVEPQLLPVNPTPGLGIVRLLQHILKEAKDRKSSPGFLIMQPYREESYSDLFRLQGVQRAALQLGILGTFVGLVMALTRLRPGSGGGFEIGEIGPLIASLDVAFTTSIAGIAVSVILGFAMMAVRGKQEAYFRSMEEATVSVASLARNAINKDEYLAELNQVQTAIHQLGDRILEQSQQTEAQTQVLQAGIRRLVETKGELDGFLSRLGEEQNTFVGEMKEVYEHLSPRRLAESFDERVGASMDRMLERWGQGIDASIGGLSELGASLREVVPALQIAQQGVAEERSHFQGTADRASSAIESLATNLEKLAERQIHWLRHLDRIESQNLDEIVKSPVSRTLGDAASVRAKRSQPAPVQAPVSAVSEELVTTVKTVGQIQHAKLEAIVTELSLLRRSMERDRLSSRVAKWLRWDWQRTASDFRSLWGAIQRTLGRGGRARLRQASSEEA